MENVAVITVPQNEWDEMRATIQTIYTSVKNITATEQKELLTPQEVREILKIGKSTFERYVNSGIIEVVKFGTKERSRRYVKRSELEAKIERGAI